MNMKFSIVLTTNRNTDSLKPLFTNTDSESELIITDSNYSSDTKNWLSHQEGYSKIVYAPVEKFRFRYTKDCILGMNTAFMYAENYWVIRADDNLEFKNDFFNICREDIGYFSNLLDNTNFSVIGNKAWESINQPKWMQTAGLTSRYVEVRNPEFTFSFGVLPIDLVYNLNGYDEVYDLGWGGEEEDFMARAIGIGHKFYFDNEMMGYSHRHESTIMGIHVGKFIYNIMLPHILNGKIRAFNAYDIRAMQSLYLAKKEEFTIK